MATFNRSSLPHPPEVIIYQYGDRLVYVKPAMEYEEAIDLALQEFPILKSFEAIKESRAHIAFYTMNTMHGRRENICISKSAWRPCVSRMLRGEIVNIVVVDPNKEAAASSPQVEPPPQYLEVPEVSAARQTRKSRSTPPHSNRGVSCSRPHSPAGSAKSSDSSSTRRRSWFRRC
ncbi:hypothetical protein J3R30DRAFT_1099182 [Lentinula aciculospora]|uniref:Uncharacterized protein n=1 Tax=Lentinula aciculospora TaxID=153920 RepID=A0A9W9A0F7_9AGAR|nr:hypothetical protein J3R30DRAFT_1099182 [Lentinula aciculospora]